MVPSAVLGNDSYNVCEVDSKNLGKFNHYITQRNIAKREVYAWICCKYITQVY